MVKVAKQTRPQDHLADAETLMNYWAGRGWPVVPLHEVTQGVRAGKRVPRCSCRQGFDCSSPGKHPRTENGIKDATTDTEQIQVWASRWPQANVGGSCVGKLVVDVDPRSGGEWPTDLPRTKRHLSGRGDGGGHLVFKLSAEQQASGVRSGNEVLGPGVDVKTGPNSYVVLPGSVHETGGVYEESDDLLVLAPDELVARVNRQGREGESSRAQVRSMLSNLLANPAKSGGRNDWLTKVAGHHARSYRRMPDVYEQMVRDANEKLAKPLEPDEVKKVSDSVWRTEIQGHPERDISDDADENNGFLTSGDYCLLCPVQFGQDSEPVAAEWSDFDLRVQGRIVAADHSQLFDLLLLRKSDRVEIPQVVRGELFGDPRGLAKWLASFGVSFDNPKGSVTTMSPNVRLLRYLMSQKAPQVDMVDRLGWDERAGGFVTLDGVVTSSGLQSHRAVRPNPALALDGACPFRYGTAGTRDTALDFLRRVLTFQDEETTAVYGAWWAASLVKHQVMQEVSMFPVMAVEAASGSGKTNGFFALMNRLGGNTHGEGNYSVPTLRNVLSTNNAGVVWVDDLEDPRKVQELVRLLTSGSAVSKMAEDRKSTLTYQLVGSLVLSGEALSLGSQKALLERSVVLRPNPPEDRTSLLPGREGRSQWADVVELQEEADALGPDGLSSVSGWVVAEVARLVDEGEVTRAISEARRAAGSGRLGEKGTVLTVGARLLDLLTGSNSYSPRVARWLVEHNQGTFTGDNTLTMEAMPWALSHFSWPDSAVAANGGRPVFVDEEGTVWFNPKRLAEARFEYLGRVSERTETADSYTEQARQMGLGGEGQRKQFRTSRHGSGVKRWYWRCTPEVSEVVLERSRS